MATIVLTPRRRIPTATLPRVLVSVAVLVISPRRRVPVSPWRHWAVGRLNGVSPNGSAVYPVARLRYCQILLFSRLEQGPDLPKTLPRLGSGRLNGICYPSGRRQILNGSAEYLETLLLVIQEQLPLSPTGTGLMPSAGTIVE